jgi:hypothetical protein
LVKLVVISTRGGEENWFQGVTLAVWEKRRDPSSVVVAFLPAKAIPWLGGTKRWDSFEVSGPNNASVALGESGVIWLRYSLPDELESLVEEGQRRGTIPKGCSGFEWHFVDHLLQNEEGTEHYYEIGECLTAGELGELGGENVLVVHGASSPTEGHLSVVQLSPGGAGWQFY